jgi:hypothetical protein
MDGLLDEWMIGYEFKKIKMNILYSEIEKSISHFLRGLFYSYVSDMQPSRHPFIQSSMGRQCIGNKFFQLLEKF